MKGKAAIWWRAHEPLEIREYPVPDVRPDGILLKLRLANICGSNIHFVEGRGPRLKGGIPQILGHDKIISYTFPLVEINKAMDFARSGQPIRVALEC